ncbi:MAG: amidohydrolase family protein [Porticoccaceae bacterium]|nr:amidohydrolase family protein [Porticoccaceae bacterium]
MMKQSASKLFGLMAGVCLSAVSIAEQFDVVINNGRVMDPETMYDAVANVGIKGGRIAAITRDSINGKETIDAKGLVVAPGFIDTHLHAVDRFGTKMAVRDGITTGMDLESGAVRVGEWYKKREKTGWQINYGTTSNMNFTRLLVHDKVKIDGPVDATNSGPYIAEGLEDGVSGWSMNRSSIDQINKIMALLDEDLRQGAIGIGTAVAYSQNGVSSYELFEVQRTAARYGRLVSVHSRYHLNMQTPTEAPIAMDEVLTNAMLLKAPLLLAHDNDYGWWEHQEKLRLAREQGHNVWGEYYPFAAGSTAVSAVFLRPEMWEDVMGYKYEETIFDPGADKFLSKSEYQDMVKSDPTHTIIVHFPARKAWMKYWLTVPEMVVASDAMVGLGADGNILPYDADPSEYAGHPRTASSYSKTLKLARDNNVPLMFTLSQLSYWNAKHLGDTGLEAMRERGRVQVGMVADLTLFDPDTVAPRATYKAGENGLPPVGIPYVLVNGEFVVKDSEVRDIRPGQPIRFPVEEKGRFIPLTAGKWFGENTIMPLPIDASEDPRAGHIHIN